MVLLAHGEVMAELPQDGWDLQLAPSIASPSAAHPSTPHEAAALDLAKREPFGTVWPLTLRDAGGDLAQGAMLKPWRLSLASGAFPGNKLYPFGERFETFSGSWGSYRLSAEQGVAFDQVPPALSLELAYPFAPFLFAYARASLKRDIRAWHDSPLGGNWPTSADEIDLNEPSLGYVVASSRWGRFTFGRFPVHMGPSPEFSLLLGGHKPWQDGALLTLKAPAARYHFYFAGLNPWLQGSPSGPLANTDYPVGSEEWRQRHYSAEWAENAHHRVYDARAKSLAVHRLETRVQKKTWGLTLGLSELQVIGGKVPDLRDLQPFTVWHNDFKYGYTNNFVHLDARLDLPWGLGLLGELALDDLPYARKEGEKQHAIVGWLFAIEQKGKMAKAAWLQRLHIVYTDPLLYHFLQPYNTLYSRHILSSNVQPESDAFFADRFVIDYPLGYVRGGDAFDFWYSQSLFLPPRPGLPRGLQVQIKAAYLQHGAITLHTPKEEVDDALLAPTGLVLEEWRASLSMALPLPGGLTVQSGLGGEHWEKGGVTGDPIWVEATLRWIWGRE